ncbi:MAG: hypothetical protein GXY48_13280 [Methanomicrobiales archaeon]|nr:hypothetical protein [Methanomicrobiales archaeon]
MVEDHKKHPDRPHCLYLWYIHGKPVCSEEKSNRECPYPFWTCPIRKVQEHKPGKVSAVSTGELAKVPVNS